MKQILREQSHGKKSKMTILILFAIALILLVYGFYEWWINQNPTGKINTKNTEGSVQILMNDLCGDEVSQYCSKTWGMETYSCIKNMDPKFLSEKCLSTFK